MTDRIVRALPRVLVVGAALLVATAAQAGTFSESALVLTPAAAADNSTGISSAKTYTHAVDFNTDDGGSVINGVTLVAGGTSGANYTLTNASTNFQNNGPGQGNDLDQASGIFDLTEDFFFSGAPGEGALVQTLTLTGLTGGTPYIASFYTAGFSGASQVIDADDDGAGINTLTTDRGDEKVIRYAYTLGAGDTDIVFTFDSVNNADAFHHYGFTNEVVPEPASLGIIALGVGALLVRRRRA